MTEKPPGILLPAPSRLIAVADDTSPDSRLTLGEKIAIYAEIRPEAGLGWYFELLARATPSSGELKSTEALARFRSLAREVRDLIWAGLRTVPMHIGDPRLKTFELRSKGLDALRRLRVPDSELRDGEPLRRQLDLFVDGYAAEHLVMESAASRAAQLAELACSPLGPLLIGEEIGFDQGREHEPISIPPSLKRHDIKKRKRDLAAHVSAASSLAIAPAADTLEAEVLEKPGLARYLILNAIAEIAGPYGFDEGNSRILKAADGLRQQAVDQLSRHSFEPIPPAPATPSESISSRDSFLVQAADIAAGFAREAMEENGLPGVCLRFDLVYLDGKRVGLPDAEEHERQIRAFHASSKPT